MNEVKTRVVDGTNCSKQLKFGVERILSDEISSRKAGETITGNSCLLFSLIGPISREKRIRCYLNRVFRLCGQLFNKYVCFERYTQAASGTIFHGAVSLSRKLRQVRSPSTLSPVLLRANLHLWKLRQRQSCKWSGRKLFQYLSTRSTSTCSQR